MTAEKHASNITREIQSRVEKAPAGVKNAFEFASIAVLAAELAKALARLDTLEQDVAALTELLAESEQ